MTWHRAVGGLCVLVALVVGLVAVPSASALVTGTTIFTCEKVGGTKGEFTKAHCSPEDGGAGEYQPVSVKEDTFTTLKGLNTSTTGARVPWKLKSVVGTTVVEIEIKEVQIGSGKIINVINPEVADEHTVLGSGILEFTTVSVISPAKDGCTVNHDNLPGVGAAGQFVSRELVFGSPKQGDALLFEPKAGGKILGSFYIQGCGTNKALNGTYNLTGTFKTSSIAGATWKFTHANTTAQKTLNLEFGGVAAAAGIEGELTLEGKDPDIPEDSYTPLTVTTVGT